MTKHITPSVDETAFNCPHCGALTTQYWYDLYVEPRSENSSPGAWREGDEQYEKVREELGATGRDFNEQNAQILASLERLAKGLPFFDKSSASYTETMLRNVHLSKCYNCKEITLWLHDKIIWPAPKEGPAPNVDLPIDIKLDFEEAGRILPQSPRGSAALLRLCIQKLCEHLGEKGTIDQCIASLVVKGLDKRIEKSLDIVRVIGNNAVHPGQIDLRDDNGTALKLFNLVNLITDALVSQPKHIEAMFDSLPQGAKDGIEIRNRKALSKKVEPTV